VKFAVRASVGTEARIVSVVGFQHGCDQPEVKASAAILAALDE
jgi:deoxyribose-phosphate aldolase